MLKVEESSGGAWAPTLCESCRSAPCTVFCRADAAALCAACDANIHSANLLARRHHRVPILPAMAGRGASGLVVRPSLNLPYHVGVPVDGERGGGVGDEEDKEQEDEDEAAASWMLLNPLKGNNIQSCRSLLFGDEGDEFLDLEDYNSNNANNNNNSSENRSTEDCDGRTDQNARRSHGGRSDAGSEFLVPNEHNLQQQHHQQGYHNMMDQFEGSHGFGYSFSLNHSASFSSMDASLVVPDATCMSDISNADQYVLPSKGTVDLFSGHPFLQVPSQFNPMDREARVLRYREKRKNRKFEKTIRYASRKAYAETRPRIKGRFAKRSDLEVEVDQMFSTSALADSSYGIVPSF